MSHTGLGVLINALTGGKGQLEPVNGVLGKTVREAVLKPEAKRDGALKVVFTDGTELLLFDDGRSCCESRWLHTDDDLSSLAGGVLREVRVDPGPTEEDAYGDPKESEFLVLRTDRATVTVVAYNEHNGYYSGFWLAAEVS